MTPCTQSFSVQHQFLVSCIKHWKKRHPTVPLGEIPQLSNLDTIKLLASSTQLQFLQSKSLFYRTKQQSMIHIAKKIILCQTKNHAYVSSLCIIFGNSFFTWIIYIGSCNPISRFSLKIVIRLCITIHVL
jgi:hypothetical protein